MDKTRLAVASTYTTHTASHECVVVQMEALIIVECIHYNTECIRMLHTGKHTDKAFVIYTLNFNS